MKLPLEAKQVFTGNIFDVYQWQQKMYDGTFVTFEMLKRANTVDIIAIEGDKILLSHQSQPTKPDFYSLFGGRAEEGEDSLTTAKRELLEESGLVSDNFELYKSSQPFHKIDWQIDTYIARNCRKVSDQHLDAGEKINILECSFDEFIDIILGDKFWGDELIIDILRMKVNGTLDEFKKRLFSD